MIQFVNLQRISFSFIPICSSQPTRLFGESDVDSYRRLRLLEITEPELKGQRNDFKAGLLEHVNFSFKISVFFFVYSNG